MDIITGKTGEAHITSSDVGHIYASIFGEGKYVLPVGNRMSLTVDSRNAVTVHSGDVCINGRVGRIRDNLSETLTVDNGQTGHTRCDWVVVRYTKSEGLESMELTLLKGSDDSTLDSTPPGYVPGNILDNQSTVDFVLYKLFIDGVSSPQATTVFNVASGFDEATEQFFPGQTIIPDGGMRSIENIFSAIRNMIYPVGSIYISTSMTNPSTIFGGTWEQIQGRFLVASGDNGAQDNEALNLSAGATGGESAHTLTLTEMAPHTHTVTDYYPTTTGKFATSSSGTTIYKSRTTATRTTSRSPGGTSATAHNNLPPYLAVYMWKRTA